MKPHSRIVRVPASTFAAAALLLGQSFLVAQAPDRAAADKPPQPNIDDIAAQIGFYAERLGESAQDDGDYNELDQTRVEKDAVTVAALALLLAQHDQDHALRPAAAAVLAAANDMAANHHEHAPTAAAYHRLSDALASKAHSADGTTTPDAKFAVTDTAMLMKQIRYIENRLKRAASRNPTDKTRSDVAGHAATLAALAAPMAQDAKQFAKSAHQQRTWVRQSEAMAAAAAQLNAAANDVNVTSFNDAVRALDATCSRCHNDFRR